MTKTTPKCTTCHAKNLSLFRSCSAEVLEDISEKKTIQLVQKGEHLLIEGEEAKGIYCIRSGVAKSEIHYSNGEGRSLILRLEGKGSIVGHRVSNKKDKQPLTITAVENMQVCHVSADKFRSIYGKCQGLRNEVMKSLLQEMQNVERRALTLVNKSVKERVAGMLIHIAEIYNYHQGGCSIHVHLDRQDMADLAGTTKEQVSQILTALRKDKLINFKAKHFKYFDLEGLNKISESMGKPYDRSFEISSNAR